MQITSGLFKSRKIKVFDSDELRPTLAKTRESVFSILNSLVNFKEATFLDAFAGSGIMSLEAVSRGFKQVYVFEQSKKAASLIKENYKALNLAPNLFIGNTLKLLKKSETKFDVIYIDPPFNSDLYEKTLAIIKENNTIPSSGIIIIEQAYDKNIDISGFELIKEKKYGYIKLLILKKSN